MLGECVVSQEMLKNQVMPEMWVYIAGDVGLPGPQGPAVCMCVMYY